MSTQPLLLCQDCDLALHNISAPVGQKVCCPRCGAVLYEVNANTVESVLAFSLTGLLFYIPANALPVMTLEVVGRSSSSTMLNGVVHLFDQGHWWMALLVLICSVIVPLLDLMMLFVLALTVKLGRWRDLAIELLRWQRHLTDWGMLEVYMLGILVAFIKMSDMGELHVGLGLMCFIALLLFTVLSSLVFNRHRFWEAVHDIGR